MVADAIDTAAAPADDQKVDILLVDDRPDKLLALEAILDALARTWSGPIPAARRCAPSCSRTSRSSSSTSTCRGWTASRPRR